MIQRQVGWLHRAITIAGNRLALTLIDHPVKEGATIFGDDVLDNCKLLI
jgi:hypothetical protein